MSQLQSVLSGFVLFISLFHTILSAGNALESPLDD